MLKKKRKNWLLLLFFEAIFSFRKQIWIPKTVLKHKNYVLTVDGNIANIQIHSTIIIAFTSVGKQLQNQNITTFKASTSIKKVPYVSSADYKLEQNTQPSFIWSQV